jgi:DNA-binding MarR family transcriptional regulator
MTSPDTIATLVDRLSRITHSLQFSEGLNPAQWNALRFLGKANKYSTSPGVLADYLGCTKGTVSQTLIALESKGFLERIRCEEDRRKVRLGLTDAGKAILKNDPLLQIERASAGVPLPHRESLIAAMALMVDDLCPGHEGPSFGKCGECCHLDCSNAAEDCSGEQRCGLTGETLDGIELEQICVDFCVGK